MGTKNGQKDYGIYADNRDVISLFSGAMGLDIGLGRAGLNVVIGQDFDASCVATMRENGHKVLGGDIREIEPGQILELTGLHIGEPFLICGGPQFRERFVLIGSRDKEDIFLPISTHFQMHQNKEYQWQTVRSAIGSLEFEQGECAAFGEERLKFLKMIPEGGNWRDLPEDLISIAMGGAYKSGGGKVGFYRRLSYDQPSPTVVTSPVQKATMMCHPTQNRPLSVREYARIQQFPDDWIFTGTTAAKYRQIGNAVPIGLAKAIGKAVLAVANATAFVQTKRFRGTNVHSKIRNAIELGGNLYAVK